MHNIRYLVKDDALTLRFDSQIASHVACECPPRTALPANDVFYRHVMAYPCTDNDFISDIAAGKQPQRDIASCDSWGCSLCDSEKAVAALKARVPFFARKGMFVKIILKPEHGVVDNNVGHRTFWMTVGARLAHLCEAPK